MSVQENKHQERKREGVYYTSPEVVKLMVCLALNNYLKTNLDTEWLSKNQSVIEELVFKYHSQSLDRFARQHIHTLLCQVKILDPAVGQGAFLLGALEELVKLRLILGEADGWQRIAHTVCNNNLYGVDRDAAVVQYCREQGLTLLFCGDSLLELPETWGQFDLVLANPPYVRQELLAKDYKKALVQKFWEQGLKLKERSDLYVYFLAQLGELLKAKGTGVFITSLAWLDVGYGGPLQEYLLRELRIKLILESACERWFSEARVNTGVMLIEKLSPLEQDNDYPASVIRFVRVKKRLHSYRLMAKGAENSMAGLISKLFSTNRYVDEEELRVYPVNEEQLLAQGMVEGTYQGSKWSKYFRAPEVYFRLLEQGKQVLCPLGEIAKVQFGLKTGCNEFFYLRSEQTGVIEPEYLVPVVKGPKEVPGYIVHPEKLKYRLLVVNQEPKHLQLKQVWSYIISGQEMGYHLRPSMAGRTWWYSIERNQEPGVLFRRFFHDKFNLPVVTENIAEDQTFYRVTYPGDVYCMGAILNSTIMALLIELSGRLALGEGVLQFAVYEAAQIPVVDPEQIPEALRVELKQAFMRLANRSSGSIYTEIQEPDRRDLDLLVLKLLGFSTIEAGQVLAEVYRAITELVSQRLTKAHTMLD